MTDLVVPADVDTISYELFARIPCIKTVSFQRGSGCVIESCAFDQCHNLAAVKYHESSLNSSSNKTVSQNGFVIGDHAFRDCGHLESIEIFDNLIRVGNGAFVGTAWFYRQPDGVIYLPLKDGMAVYCVKGNPLTDGTTLVIPDGVTEIVGSAFYHQTGITGLSMPTSLRKIGEFAFDGCQSLKGNFFLGRNIREIGEYAFRDTNFSKVTIEDSNEPLACGILEFKNFDEFYLGRQLVDLNGTTEYNCAAFDSYYAFEKADKITYGKCVTSLGTGQVPNGYQREKSTPLEVISMNPQPPVCRPDKAYYPWDPDVYPFDNLDVARCVLKVPTESVDLYKSADGWRNFTTIEGTEFAGVNSTFAGEEVEIIGAFDVSGCPVPVDTKGIIMVKYSDGSVRKLLNQ